MGNNNSKHFLRLYNQYKLLALDMFTWENLPEGMESRHIEKALYEYGQAFFYDHKDFGKICLPCTNSGTLNTYSEPTSVVINSHLVHDTIPIKDGVRILNNELEIPTDFYVRQYAIKMMEVEKSIEMNIKQQRYPYFIETDKKNEYTMKQVFKQRQEGEPYIYVNKNLGISEANVHQLSVPFIALELNKYKYELEREILTFFGLNNTVEKEERLLVDEVNSNNDFIERNVSIMYKTRKRAEEFINKKFNCNCKCIKNNERKSNITPKGKEKEGKEIE